MLKYSTTVHFLINCILACFISLVYELPLSGADVPKHVIVVKSHTSTYACNLFIDSVLVMSVEVIYLSEYDEFICGFGIEVEIDWHARTVFQCGNSLPLSNVSVNFSFWS
jgi:hypothetical protein